jgi:hypothetical protein
MKLIKLQEIMFSSNELVDTFEIFINPDMISCLRRIGFENKATEVVIGDGRSYSVRQSIDEIVNATVMYGR